VYFTIFARLNKPNKCFKGFWDVQTSLFDPKNSPHATYSNG
jgi:hypothetical protein